MVLPRQEGAVEMIDGVVNVRYMIDEWRRTSPLTLRTLSSVCVQAHLNWSVTSGAGSKTWDCQDLGKEPGILTRCSTAPTSASSEKRLSANTWRPKTHTTSTGASPPSHIRVTR